MIRVHPSRVNSSQMSAIDGCANSKWANFTIAYGELVWELSAAWTKDVICSIFLFQSGDGDPWEISTSPSLGVVMFSGKFAALSIVARPKDFVLVDEIFIFASCIMQPAWTNPCDMICCDSLTHLSGTCYLCPVQPVGQSAPTITDQSDWITPSICTNEREQKTHKITKTKNWKKGGMISQTGVVP